MRESLRLGQFPQIHRYHTAYSFFHHGDSVDNVCAGHGPFVVRDNHKLTVFAKGSDNVIELVNVGIIQGSIKVIEYTKG